MILVVLAGMVRLQRVTAMVFGATQHKRIISDLDLKNVKYYETAKFGHFGNKEFSWERK